MNEENEMLADAIIEDSVTANCGHMVECTEVCAYCDRCQECCTCRVTQTIDRLISNLPDAVIKLKVVGLTSLARQIQNDLDNLVHWQKKGGLATKERYEMWRNQASMYKKQHGKDTNLIGLLAAQSIKRAKFKPDGCTCVDEPGDEYYCSVHGGGERDQCDCSQINWVKGPHHQTACPMWKRPPPEHHLKTWPRYFEEIATGNKTFDLREDDREFSEGDLLILEEWDPETELYSGRVIKMKVGFMIKGDWGLSDTTCAMSLLKAGADE